MEKSREFIQKLTYDINNGGTMELIQRGHDGTVLISDNSTSKTEYIPAGDMVMLINLYRYIKDNDIQNDFINYNGKNQQPQRMHAGSMPAVAFANSGRLKLKGGVIMQVLTGTKRKITLMQWNEQLEKAKRKLEESKECYRRFGDDDSKQWIVEDEKKVTEIEQKIKEVISFMDANNII